MVIGLLSKVAKIPGVKDAVVKTGKKLLKKRTRGKQKKPTKKQQKVITEKIKDDAGRVRMARYEKSKSSLKTFGEFMESKHEKKQLRKMRKDLKDAEGFW